MQIKYNPLKLVNGILLKLNKRFLYLGASLSYFSVSLYFITFVPKNLLLNYAIIFSLLITFLFYVSMVPANFSYYKVLKQLPLPLGYIVASFLLLSFFPNLIFLFKLAFVIANVFIFYFLLLSFNVLFVVEHRGSVIPLLRPARTTFLLMQIITTFFLFTAIYKIVLPDPLTEVTFLLQTLVVFLCSFTFANSYWWSQHLEKEITSFVGNESMVIAFLTSFASLALSFYPTESFFRSLGVSIVYYICINFFQNVVTHKFTPRNLIEYFVLGAVGLVFIFLF